MQNVMVKVYGYLRPCTESEVAPLRAALRLLGEPVSEVLKLEGELLNISFEGSYFPLEDFLEALVSLPDAGRKGRVDYIDMEGWSLTRYNFENGFVTSSKGDLNDVLSFSGH